MLRALIFKMGADFRESLRYPIQFVFSFIIMMVMVMGIGLGAAKTSGQSFAEGTLATFMSLIAVTLFNIIPQGSNEHAELPEEKMTLPYALFVQILIFALMSCTQIALALTMGYSFINILNANGVTGDKAWLAIPLAGLSMVGPALLMFAAKQLFRKIDGFSNVVSLVIISLAFLPLEKLSAWSNIVPLVGVTRWVQGAGSLWLALLSALCWLFIGIFVVRWAERAAVRRGISSYA